MIIKSWQSQYDQLKSQNEKELAEHEKTRINLAEIKQDLEKLQISYNEVEAKLHSNELIVQMARNSKSSSSAISRLTHLEEETKDLHMKLSLAEKEIVSLKIQLEESKAHSKQYKTISETMEKTMKEASESNEKTKQVLEAKINGLNEELNQLKTNFEEQSNQKNELETTLNLNKQTYEAIIDTLEKEKAQLTSDLEILNNKHENLEKICEERTKFRDESVAKIAVLEEQIKSTQENYQSIESSLNEKISELNETKQTLTFKIDELENEKRLNSQMNQNFDSTNLFMKESFDKLQLENQNLTQQNNLLQQELSKMGQDLIILQKQDSLNTIGSEKMITSEMESSSSSSNLLEINRYLRTQKDQIEEKFETLKLNFEINQQRLKSIENELEFYRKQSELYENEINQLKSAQNLNVSTKDESSISQDNVNLILDTNKRLKEECDSLNSETTRLNSEIKVYEEEITNLKANLSISELKNESLAGETNCLKSEVKRWKDRVDSLLRNSDNGEEWVKIQSELQEAQEKTQVLTDMINELRTNLTDLNGKNEQLTKDLDTCKQQLINDKQKHQQDIDAIRLDKTKREEMFKTLVGELKDVVTTVQKELQLSNIDWGMGMKGGTHADRLKSVKDDLGNIKKNIIEKLKSERDDFKAKLKQAEESVNEIQIYQKKLEECENKVKEKEIRIGQMNNFINTTKTKLQAQKKQIDDLTQQLATSTAAHSDQPAVDNVNKNEFDALRSKYLQSQIDNERLKKELVSTTSALNEAKQQQSTAITQPIVIQQTTSPSKQQQQNITSSSTISDQISSSQQPPTAYIAPSRVAKLTNTSVVQSPTIPTTTASPAQSNLQLRRTAAVQPTSHDSGAAINTRQQQQMVTPLNVNNEWQQQQTQSQQSDNNNQFDSLQDNQLQQVMNDQPTTSTGSTGSNFMAKRIREDDQ